MSRLTLISVGPGRADLIPPMARKALEESDVIVGYSLYLRWIAPWIEGKEIHSPPLTRERERAQLALASARAGRPTALVSSGDIGVYAMAALVFEELAEDDVPVSVIPGITAATSCAALLGAPLSHDFATLSLSDLLCPWTWIEQRARAIAEADMACALYNVQSRSRQEGVYRILRLLLEHKRPETCCGVVRNAWRPDQSVRITTLGELLNQQFDMLTTLIIGNRFTRKIGNQLFTPRGYNDWSEPTTEPPPKGATWVFSGTSDGNEAATMLAAQGHQVVVSTASEYGGSLAAEIPGVTVISGRRGVEARRRLLSDAVAVVDATHPYAEQMTAQLHELCAELSLPYLRYQRPAAAPDSLTPIELEAAPAAAMGAGTRIFLATGANDAATFLQAPGAQECEWFVRLTPDPDRIRRLEGLGVPRANICAMQGPFDADFNTALWRQWGIDCVVTKDSGEAGGFAAKQAACEALGIPMVLVARPPLPSAPVVESVEAISDWMTTHVEAR
jgi:precorrin-3B C17-methyltransferase